MATRSFVENLSFRYTGRVSGWYRQRRTWGIATGVWLKDHYRLLARVLVRKPQVMLPFLLLIMPSLLPVFFNCLLPDALYLSIINLALSVLSRQPSCVPLVIFLTSFGILAVKNGVLTALTYTALSCIFYSAATGVGYHFNPVEFLCYYLIYSPFSLLMNIIGIFRVMTHNDMVDLDWKV